MAQVRSEHVLALLLILAGLHLYIFLALPQAVAVDSLDPVQVQMLLENYREQLAFFKWAAGVVCTAETGAIVFLTKKLLESQNERVTDAKDRETRKDA